MRAEVKRLQAANNELCQEKTVVLSLLKRLEGKSAETSSLMRTCLSVFGVKRSRDVADHHDDDVNAAVKKRCNRSVSTPAEQLRQEDQSIPSVTDSPGEVTLFPM